MSVTVVGFKIGPVRRKDLPYCRRTSSGIPDKNNSIFAVRTQSEYLVRLFQQVNRGVSNGTIIVPFCVN